MLAPAPSTAATTVQVVGGHDQGFPIEDWLAASKMPTPDVLIRVHYDETCPGNEGFTDACTGGLMAGGYDITFDPAATSGTRAGDSEYWRDVWYHEVGHVVALGYFGHQLEHDFTTMLGYDVGRGWEQRNEIGSTAGPTYIEPAEWFAEAYASCAWGGDRPTPAYGFNLTYRQLLPICHRISEEITGSSSIEAPPITTAPLCSPYCQAKLGVNDRFVSPERFVAGSAGVSLSYGGKTFMLDKGCSGRLNITRDDWARLNYCSGTVKVTTFTYKRLKVRYWGSTPAGSDDPLLPTVTHTDPKVTIDGGGPGPFPISQWVATAKVATPSINVSLSYGPCVQADAPACVSDYNNETYPYLVRINPAFLGQPGKDSEYYRAILYRSLGTMTAQAYFGPELQDRIKVLLGDPEAAPWGGGDASIPYTTSTPAKWFSEAYATCAWGGDRPAASVSYGFNRSYASLKPICDAIDNTIAPAQLVMPPPPTAADLVCAQYCSRKLIRGKRWTSTRLKTGSIGAVVKVGKLQATLASGCHGTVRIGSASVKLDYCSGKLVAKSLGSGAPQVRYWGISSS